jgi:hypothetical protein
MPSACTNANNAVKHKTAIKAVNRIFVGVKKAREICLKFFFVSQHKRSKREYRGKLRRIIPTPTGILSESLSLDIVLVARENLHAKNASGSKALLDGERLRRRGWVDVEGALAIFKEQITEVLAVVDLVVRIDDVGI